MVVSKSFPTDKDNIIDDLENSYDLDLSEEEYDRLRQLTQAELFLVTMLMARAIKNERK